MQPALSLNEERQEDKGRRDTQGLISGEPAGSVLVGEGHGGTHAKRARATGAFLELAQGPAMARQLTF